MKTASPSSYVALPETGIRTAILISGDFVFALQAVQYEQVRAASRREIAAAVDWLFEMEDELKKPAAYVP